MSIIILPRFCSGRVRHWAVVENGTVLFKSDHKASVLRVLNLLTGREQPMRSTLDTLILLSCSCGRVMATRQERKDGLCRTCADVPAVFDVRPDVIAAYALATVHGEGIAQTLDAVTATVEAWNTRPGDYAL